MQNAYSNGHAYGVKHLLSPITGPLDEVLAVVLNLKKSQTDFLLDLGAIYLNQKRLPSQSAPFEIQKNDYLRVHQTPRRFPCDLILYPECVVYEDTNLIIVNKAAGLPVHPTVDNIRENLLSQLQKMRGDKLYITHRLDTATSGLIIYAKNSESQTRVNQLIANGEVKKIYRALVHGQNIQEGEWKHWMEPSPRAPKTVSRAENTGWSECRLKILDQNPFQHPLRGPLSEVLIELITGRTHQIRSQLACEGHPIVGDLSYGSNVSLSENKTDQIYLQSCHLQLPGLSPHQGDIVVRLDARPWSL